MFMTDFDDWFYEVIGYHLRAEEFWDDFDSKNRDRMIEWMKASFDAGRMSNGTTKEN
jgi:hypothetical protein